MSDEATFRLGLLLRLSTFQIGSAMADILTAGVWNRIMISDFGIPAWPVGLLIALRNLMAPVSLWIGHRSDTKPLWGKYRTSYIWLGRGLIVLALPLLGFSTVRLEANISDPVGWLVALLCFLLYGLGTLISGSPYLALVRDSAPEAKQGIAIGLVNMMLIGMFPIVAVGFSRMLVTYDAALFWRLVLFVMVVAGFFWFFGVVGAERRHSVPAGSHAAPQLSQTFSRIWADRHTRRFFLFLFFATFFAWMQDNILEPLGADLFHMEVEQTTRLTSFWGTPTVLVLIASFVIWRRQRPEQQSGASSRGLATMGLGMLAVSISAMAGREWLFLSGLVLFGAGFGLYTFGGLSLMAAMSPAPHSGAYLGLWSVSVLVSKGAGTFVGGVFRDLFLAVNLSEALAYGLTTALAATGMVAAAWFVLRLDVPGFVRDSRESDF